ncbi:MAG: hypothetical protein R3B70_16415 [Polyangiaceae bacterium]
MREPLASPPARPPSRTARPPSRNARPLLALTALLAATAAACAPAGPQALAAPQDDGTLVLVAGTFDRTCEEVLSIIFQCGRWELFVRVGAPDQTPGPKPMITEDTFALGYFSDGAYDGDSCSLYGDSFEQGTFEITDTTDQRVKFTFAGTANDDFDADGDYDAAICPPP